MKKLKKIQAGGFYIFRGRASADSSFIESVSEAQKFWTYFSYYLNDYLKIYEYALNQDGWIMIVKIQSAEELSNKNPFYSDSIAWRMISEQVRKALSSYVLAVNRSRGRTGSLVHSSYERFYFSSLTEAKSEIAKVRKRALRLGQWNKKYRGKPRHYQIDKRTAKGSVFLGSLAYRKGGKVRRCFELERLVETELAELVLSNLVENAKFLHKSHIPPTFPSNSS